VTFFISTFHGFRRREETKREGTRDGKRKGPRGFHFSLNLRRDSQEERCGMPALLIFIDHTTAWRGGGRSILFLWIQPEEEKRKTLLAGARKLEGGEGRGGGT